jgi:type 1 fimbriae regulatory protein FimB/type 1 fimbriae regulatory protein FimE
MAETAAHLVEHVFPQLPVRQWVVTFPRRLRQLKRDWPESPYLFVSERGGPMTASNVRKLVAKAGQDAGLPFPAHPHMLRHACGYKLANDGHDTRALQHYLGHKNITHTVRYTEMAPDRFKGFWKD